MWKEVWRRTDPFYDRKNRENRDFENLLYNQRLERNSSKNKEKYKGISYTRFFWFFRLRSAIVMLEKDIVAAILRHLKNRPRCFAWKTHGGMYGTAGIPDIIACVDGRFYAFEVKQPGGRLTRLQEVTLGKIQAAGGAALMVTSVEEVKAAISAEGGAI